MIARKLALLCLALIVISTESARAQSETRIRVVIPSIDRVEEDLKWIIQLSPTPDLKKQSKNLKEDILDAFTQGLDPTQPLAVDFVLRKDEVSREMHLPIRLLRDKKAGFIQNLEGMGYTVKDLTKDTFFEVAERKKKGFFVRYDKEQKYAISSSVKAALPAVVPNQKNALAPLLALEKDVVAELKNDAGGVQQRQKDFKELRKQFEALIKFRRNEDPDAFELRKLSLIQQLNEIERFVVEAEHILATWVTDSKGQKHGRGEFQLTAIPGTSLEKSIEQFAVKPSYFANVTMHGDPLLAGRITFPLDDVRKAHAKDFFKAVRAPLAAEISKRPGKTEPQKAAMKTAMGHFLEMLDAGAEMGVIDGFIECFPTAPGKNVMVGGMRAADGKAAEAIIKILPEIKPDWNAKSQSEHGSVTIHEITIPESRLASFQKLFPGESVVFVGTSKEAVWLAAGVDAVTHLKAAIDQTAQPAPEKVDPVVLSYLVQVSELVTLMEILEKEVPAGNAQLSKEEKQRLKDLEKFRKLAQAAMAGCQSLLTGELRRNGNKIEGFLEVNECTLKYVGSIIADTVKSLQ